MEQINYIITMDLAVKLLCKGIITPEEYMAFLQSMTTKYGQNNLKILYQIKLDMFLN